MCCLLWLIAHQIITTCTSSIFNSKIYSVRTIYDFHVHSGVYCTYRVSTQWSASNNINNIGCTVLHSVQYIQYVLYYNTYCTPKTEKTETKKNTAHVAHVSVILICWILNFKLNTLYQPAHVQCTSVSTPMISSQDPIKIAKIRTNNLLSLCTISRRRYCYCTVQYIPSRDAGFV